MKKLFIPLAAALCLSACNNNDDDSPQNNPTGISGNYSLVNVSGSIAGVNNNFNPGVIRWQINENTHTLAVVNNYDDNNGSVEDFLETGNYTFETTTAETGGLCPFKYVASENELGCLTVQEDGTLIFAQPYADGYFLTLKPD